MVVKFGLAEKRFEDPRARTISPSISPRTKTRVTARSLKAKVTLGTSVAIVRALLHV